MDVFFLLRNYFVAFIALLCSGQVISQQLPNPNIAISRLYHHIVFENADRVTKRHELELMALTPEGAQGITKAQLGFNSALDDLKIIQAKTLKSDGKEINVQTDGFAVQKGHSAPGTGVTLPDWEVREINFPDVKVGDRVFREVVQTSKTSPLPGFQTFQDFLIPTLEATEVAVRIEAPASMVLSVSAMPDLVKSLEGDKQVWQGKLKNKATPLEDNASSIRMRIPHVMVSTLANHQDLGQRFAGAMLEKAVITAEVDTLAKRLTANATTDEQRARAIYDWVRKEIKYVALFIGVGGWVPHDTDHILAKRYGDCKDHVTLMHALLKAVGIESRPALINTTPQYDLDPVPVGFNHVITYIPALNKFLDATATHTPFEMLPHVVYGKPVVVSNGHQADIKRTPALSSSANVVVSQTHMKIGANGSAEVTLKVSATGHAAFLVRQRLIQIPAGMGSVAVQKILRQSGFQGKGELRFDTIDRDSLTQSFEANFNIRDMLKNPEAGATLISPPLDLPIYIQKYMGSHQQERRSFPYICNSMRIREEFTMDFEEGYKLSRVPVRLSREIPGVRYSSEYQRTGNRIEGWRQMDIDHPEQECSPDEYLRRRPVMIDTVKHLRSQVLFER